MHQQRVPTAFEQRVYNIIRRIPRGQTRSYGWVARQLGKPGAARAVGLALKRNPFAPRVPCHRVVRSDGSLGGYSARGGLRRKRDLLARERCTQSVIARRLGEPTKPKLRAPQGRSKPRLLRALPSQRLRRIASPSLRSGSQ